MISDLWLGFRAAVTPEMRRDLLCCGCATKQLTEFVELLTDAIESAVAHDHAGTSGEIPQGIRNQVVDRYRDALDDNRRLRTRVETLEGRLATLYGELRRSPPHNV